MKDYLAGASGPGGMARVVTLLRLIDHATKHQHHMYWNVSALSMPAAAWTTCLHMHAAGPVTANICCRLLAATTAVWQVALAACMSAGAV